MAQLVRQPAKVKRWFVRGEFKPGSPKQIRQLMAAFNEHSRPGKHSKSGQPSTDKQVMHRLAERHQVFKDILKWRDVKKLDTTYATGLTAHADEHDRIHANFTHRPYTMRLACQNPNLQNIPQDDEEDSLRQISLVSKLFRQVGFLAIGTTIGLPGSESTLTSSLTDSTSRSLLRGAMRIWAEVLRKSKPSITTGRSTSS